MFTEHAMKIRLKFGAGVRRNFIGCSGGARLPLDCLIPVSSAHNSLEGLGELRCFLRLEELCVRKPGENVDAN